MGNNQIIGSELFAGENYPPYSRGKTLEEYACDYFNDYPQFIPIYWTRILNHGTPQKIIDIFNQLKNYPIEEKSFVVSTHDDAPIKIWGEKVKYFSAGGRVDGVTPIPLVAQNFPYLPTTKTNFAQFCGSLTHPLRNDLSLFAKDDGVIIKTKTWSPKISREEEIENFREMAASTFAFCPRGYGGTSFRLYEAIRLKCIPIYASDIHVLPFPDKVRWEDVAILCNDLKEGYLKARTTSRERIAEMLFYTETIKDNLLDFNKICENIKELVGI